MQAKLRIPIFSANDREEMLATKALYSKRISPRPFQRRAVRQYNNLWNTCTSPRGEDQSNCTAVGCREAPKAFFSQRVRRASQKFPRRCESKPMLRHNMQRMEGGSGLLSSRMKHISRNRVDSRGAERTMYVCASGSQPRDDFITTNFQTTLGAYSYTQHCRKVPKLETAA